MSAATINNVLSKVILAFSLGRGYSRWRIRADFMSKVILELVPKE